MSRLGGTRSSSVFVWAATASDRRRSGADRRPQTAGSDSAIADSTAIGHTGAGSNGDPTAVDRARLQGELMQALRHLVVGTDFSRCADSAMTCAITIANLGLAQITLVHVCELSTELGLPDSVATSAIDDELLRSCTQRLAAELARHARCGVEINALLRTGKPWEKLNNVVVEVGASLIVIGRCGLGETTGALGSVARHVLRSSTRPVLVAGPNDIVMTRSEVA